MVCNGKATRPETRSAIERLTTELATLAGELAASIEALGSAEVYEATKCIESLCDAVRHAKNVEEIGHV